MNEASVSLHLQSLPELPGVYQFFDKEGKYLYVGKAKNLKKRVSSYFQKQLASGKLRVLVNKIHSIRHIVVNSENDALLLENNLIKTHQPKYNVMLKDDKTYPWICIKKEPVPRVFYTRRVLKDGSEYFGPYSSVKSVTNLLALIKQLYPLRTCKYDLSPDKIKKGKYNICLEYHLKNCKGPCQNLQSEEDYLNPIKAIRNIIKGNIKECLLELEKEMQSQAHLLEFENAHLTKEKIISIKNYQSKSTVVNPKINNVDVFSIISDSDYAYVNFLEIKKGAIIRSHTSEIKKKLDESDQDLLELSIVELRNRFESSSKEIIVPMTIIVPDNTHITIPKVGDKNHLLNLSRQNAQSYRRERIQKIRVLDPDQHTNRIMTQMKTDLRLPKEPRHIECFDNSNIQGKNPVAACVVFKDGKPSKKEYRHFHIKTVEGPNDFASMEEIVYRRYRHLLDNHEKLPDLIVIDGGKGQLSSAIKSLETLDLRGKISILSIAKKLEELYFPDDNDPLYLSKTSETLKVIQQIRNEAHRFGIGFHRKSRSNTSLKSSLDDIEGIGEATKKRLLSHFKSVSRIKETSQEELEKIIGVHKASKVLIHFS